MTLEPTYLAGVIALLRDQERLDEGSSRERDVSCRVPVGHADMVEKWRRLSQGAPRQEQSRRRERGGPRTAAQVSTEL